MILLNASFQGVTINKRKSSDKNLTKKSIYFEKKHALHGIAENGLQNRK